MPRTTISNGSSPACPTSRACTCEDDAEGSSTSAGRLLKRVSSYFQKRDHDIKTRVLVKIIRDMEFIVTDSEIEALILESSLIKKHRPKFNIQKKDDKRYPYIAVTLDEEYPRVIYTRTIRKNGTRYFGPYTDARAARGTVALINNIFKLKICTRDLPEKQRASLHEFPDQQMQRRVPWHHFP